MTDIVQIHDLEAEAAVLSCILLDPSTYVIAASSLTPESFYSFPHSLIFKAAGDVYASTKTIDAVLVGTLLRDSGQLDKVGGLSYITECINAAPAIANIDPYVQIVASKHRLRMFQAACKKYLAQSQMDPDQDTVFMAAEKEIRDIASHKNTKDGETLKEATFRAFSKIDQDSRLPPGQCSGIPTGFKALDRACGGLQMGETIAISGRAGMAKTAFALNSAMAVVEHGEHVIFFSIEMPNVQLALRAICAEAQVDSRRARTNSFTPSDWTQLTNAATKVSRLGERMKMFELPCNMMDIRHKVMSYSNEIARTGGRLGLVVVDYLQLLRLPHGMKSREEGVGENARELKLLAKEFSVCVMELCQLNRGLESRPDKRPLMSDIRDSGQVEEAADWVIGLYRDDYYHQNSKTPGIAELIILKARHSATGTIELGFDAKSTRFYNLEDSFQ